MGNTEKFDMIANRYDTPERIHISKETSNAIREYLVDAKNKSAIDLDMVHNGFDQTKLTGIMTEMGYRDIKSKTFYTGSKIFMGHDASMFILDSQK